MMSFVKIWACFQIDIHNNSSILKIPCLQGIEKKKVFSFHFSLIIS